MGKSTTMEVYSWENQLYMVDFSKSHAWFSNFNCEKNKKLVLANKKLRGLTTK